MTPMDMMASYAVSVAANLSTPILNNALKAILPPRLFDRMHGAHGSQQELANTLGEASGCIEAYGGTEFLAIKGALLTAINSILLDAQAGRLSVDKSHVKGKTVEVKASDGSFHLSESVLQTHSGTGLVMGKDCSIVGGKGTAIKMT